MSSRSPNGSAAASPGTWPSPPAPPAPTSWTSTSTAKPETATPPSPRSSARAWSTARQPTCGPRPAGCTPTSPATDQHNGRLPSHHLDFRSQGGYILAPPSQIDGKPYRLIKKLGGHGGLDWAAVTALLEPQRHQQRPAPGQAPDRALGQLARWVASQPEGNRNSGLYWAANRALDADPAADLSPLAAAARQAGLGEPEITRTLDSARKTSHQAEAVN